MKATTPQRAHCGPERAASASETHSKFVGSRFDPFRSIPTNVDLYCENRPRVPIRPVQYRNRGRGFATILVTKTFAGCLGATPTKFWIGPLAYPKNVILVQCLTILVASTRLNLAMTELSGCIPNRVLGRRQHLACTVTPWGDALSRLAEKSS